MVLVHQIGHDPCQRLLDIGTPPRPAAFTVFWMSSSRREQLSEEKYIRAQMFAGDKSRLRRYADLVVGAEGSYWQLLRYELITSLFGGLPGALGLALRQVVYPRLFQRCGRGVIFGRHLVVRNGHRIWLGNQVVIDDGCVIDGRGAGSEGVVIGDRVILGRQSAIQAKIGPIHIGADCDIGMLSVIHAQGGVIIGQGVVLGGGCKISGGIFQTERTRLRQEVGGTDGMTEREQTRWTRGPIRIGERCQIGMGALLLDNVEVGEGAVIGAGSVVTRSVPAYAVAAGVPAKVLRMRSDAAAP